MEFGSDVNAGILFRVTNPSMGGAGNDAQLGTDFLQGYLGLNRDSLGVLVHFVHIEDVVGRGGTKFDCYEFRNCAMLAFQSLASFLDLFLEILP